MATRITADTIEEMRRYETVYGVREFESELDHRPIYYPVSDGMPMSDSYLGGIEMVRIMQTLDDWYADVPDVYVWMNMFVYFEPGNPHAAVSPDVAVAIGAEKAPERIVYFVWREGVPPTVVFEVLSSNTHRRDQGPKRESYQRMGVKEYILYDPHHEFMDPPLQVNVLEGGVYRRLEPDETGAFVSETLGLRLRMVNRRLRFFRLDTGEVLLSPAERTLEAERRVAEAEAEIAAAAERAAAAESEAARLREELAALRARLQQGEAPDDGRPAR